MTRNRAAIDRAVERWDAGDLDGYLELYDDGIVLHGYTPEPRPRCPGSRSFASPETRA